MEETDLSALFARQSRAGGQRGGLAALLLNDYDENTASGNRRLAAMSIDELQPNWKKPNEDPMNLVYSWQEGLTKDAAVRGRQRVEQQKGTSVSNKPRGIAQTFTAELSHPLDNNSRTFFANYAFMPAEPNKLQIAKALREAKAINSFADGYRLGEQYYTAAPGQPFRHYSSKG